MPQVTSRGVPTRFRVNHSHSAVVATNTPGIAGSSGGGEAVPVTGNYWFDFQLLIGAITGSPMAVIAKAPLAVAMNAYNQNGEIRAQLYAAAVEVGRWRKSGGAANTFTDTDVNTTTDQITVPVNTYETGDAMTYTKGTTAPAPLVDATVYYIIKVDSTHVKLATTLTNALAGTAIDLTTAGGVGETNTLTPLVLVAGDQHYFRSAATVALVKGDMISVPGTISPFSFWVDAATSANVVYTVNAVLA